MPPFIRIRNEWQDDDVILLTFQIDDGTSSFVNAAYVGRDWLAVTADALETFGQQVHGGLYNLEAGTAGCEYAEGAALARFHFFKPTELYISTWQQSDYFPFKGNQVASEARMYLRTEPGMVDRFVEELRALNSGALEEATLTCIPRDGT